MGFFDSLQSGDVGGLLGTIGQGLADRRGLLYGIAANGFAGAQQGMASDRAAAEMRQKEQQRALMGQALTKFAADRGIDPAYAGSEEVFKMFLDDENKKKQLALQERNLSGDEAYRNANLGLEREKWNYTKNAKDAPEFGPVGGEDPVTGAKPYGFIDRRNRTVTPYGTAPEAEPNPLVDEARAKGVPAKAYIAEKAKQAAQEGTPTTEMRNKLSEKSLLAQDLDSALVNYHDLVSKYGRGVLGDGQRAAIGAAYGDLIIKMKEAAKLGVINAPDIPLMNRQLEDAAPDGLQRWNPANAIGMQQRIEAQVRQQREAIRRGMDAAKKAYSGKPVELPALNEDQGAFGGGSGRSQALPSGTYNWTPGKRLAPARQGPDA